MIKHKIIFKDGTTSKIISGLEKKHIRNLLLCKCVKAVKKVK